MHWLVRISFVATCFALIGFALHIINTYFVNVPLLDNWSFIEFYEKVHNNTATFHDYAHQHNEHRMLFPRIIFAPLALLTGWDLTYEAYAIVFVLLVNFIAVVGIAYHQRSSELPILVPLSVLVTCALLFPLIQYGSLLFPINLIWFNVTAGASVGIFLLVWPISRFRLLRYILAASACVVATYSAANGMSLWLALLPSVIVFARESAYKIRWILAWFVLFVIFSSLYFVGYEKPGGHPDVTAALFNPVFAIKYFLILLGRPLVPWGNIPPMIIVGGILFTAFIYFSIAYLRRFGTRLSDQYAPWLSLGLVAIMYAAMVTIGRVGLGEETAVTSDRYMTTTMLLTIALAHLVRLFMCDRHAQSKTSTRPHKLAYSVVFLYGALFAYLVDTSVATIERVEAWSVKTRQYDQCLELIHYAPSSCLRELFPAWRVLKKHSAIVERLGFRQFEKGLPFLDPDSTGKRELRHGHINLGESLTTPVPVNKDNHFEMTGWVVRPSLLRPFMVLLSYNDERPKFFTSTRVGTKILPGHTRTGWGFSPWAVIIDERALPVGEHRIRAWIYDREARRFIKLRGEIPVVVSKSS